MSFFPAGLPGTDGSTDGSTDGNSPNDSEDTVVQEIPSSSDTSQETVFDQKNNTSPSTTSEFSNEKAVLEDVVTIANTERPDTNLTGDENPALVDLPWHVRRVVSLDDDPTLPTITFRYFLLSLFFVAPGAFLAQMVCYRTTYAPYSIFFVQIGSNYVGEFLAWILPAWEVQIPFTNWSFNLNPGPFSVKEHVLVVICAASGATYNLAYGPISIAELFFGYELHPIIAIVFMWSVVWIGYSYAALARQFLIYDPAYPWLVL